MSQTDDPVPEQTARSTLWTREQLTVAAMPSVTCLLLAVILLIAKPGYLDILFRHPLGVKMVVSAAVLLIVGAAAYLVGCLGVNACRKTRPQSALVFSILLIVAYLLFFGLPSIFTVVTGPAAVRIIDNIERHDR